MAAASFMLQADSPTSHDLVGECWSSAPSSQHGKKSSKLRISRTVCSQASPKTSEEKALPRHLTSIRRSDGFLTFGQKRFPRLSYIVLSKEFEVFIGLVIVLNCVTMGFEAEMMLGKAKDLKTFVDITEHLITSIFVVELILRVLINGWWYYVPFLGSLWNFLDAMLVIGTGVVVVWIMPLLESSSDGTLQTLAVLRALRLVRLVRVVANFEIFHEVWLLLRGLMESGRVLFWTVIVIFFITYVFAIFGVALLSVNLKDEYDATLPANSELENLVSVTSGVFPFMYTLIQVLTLDSWNGIARPMMDHVGWSWAFFYSYIAVAVIVMMNLVTAVIVDNALKNSQKDASDMLLAREKQKQNKLSHFRQVFEHMDADGNGQLSWSEFESAFEDEELATELRLLGIEPDSCREIFDLLDTGDGVLSIQEFFQGLDYMEGGARAKELLRANKQLELVVKLICQQTQEFREDLDELLRLTPGARVRDRKGTFRTRALCRNESRGIDLRSSSASLHTYVSSPSKVSGVGVLKLTLNSPREDAASFVDVVRRLEQVSSLVSESQQDFKGSFDACLMMVDSCHKKMLSLINDMGAVREGPTHEDLVGMDVAAESESHLPHLLTRVEEKCNSGNGVGCGGSVGDGVSDGVGDLPPKSHWRQEFAKGALPQVPSLLQEEAIAGDSLQFRSFLV